MNNKYTLTESALREELEDTLAASDLNSIKDLTNLLELVKAALELRREHGSFKA